ncbi:thiamine phosphate synthase [Cytobacillus kochii]|uniref:thiamine phosphate synthase n=1 Tax=Cytobacillus kochii TaxID=859143 RepID=UPI002E1BA909|nr:thiamine phosphate synthase [Cytobacillus kochii]MED1604737.1 thiamine phosphate synthase [Cytobacillus kochii]
MDYRLYLVTDDKIANNELYDIVRSGVKGGVTIVQLREKTADGQLFYEKAKTLQSILKPLDIPLIINDRVDIALAVGAAGVHVGQDDLRCDVVRKIVPDDMVVGISVSNVEEAKLAQEQGANYVGIGSVFPTTSKSDADLLAPGMLEEIIAAIDIPAVAIGGIQLENIKMLKNRGLAGVSVVSAISKSKNPEKSARDLLQLFL